LCVISKLFNFFFQDIFLELEFGFDLIILNIFRLNFFIEGVLFLFHIFNLILIFNINIFSLI